MSLSLRWRCAIYDAEGEMVNRIDFGVVPEGQTRDKEYIIQNLEEDPVFDIRYNHENPDITITGPERLKIMEKAPLYVRWRVTQDSLKLDEGLRFTAKMIRT